jgi:hypothetical protein
MMITVPGKCHYEATFRVYGEQVKTKKKEERRKKETGTGMN